MTSAWAWQDWGERYVGVTQPKGYIICFETGRVVEVGAVHSNALDQVAHCACYEPDSRGAGHVNGAGGLLAGRKEHRAHELVACAAEARHDILYTARRL